MIAATLLVSFGLTTPAQPSAPTLAVAPAEARVHIELEETRFSAQSHADGPLLFVVASEESGLRSGFWLPAGARYEEDFARGTLTGLMLEVLDVSNGARESSGALRLDDLAPDEHARLWVLEDGHAWTSRGEGAALSAATPAGSLLPPELRAHFSVGPRDAAPTPTVPGPTHVPVPTPTDKPKDTPPRKRRRQLPPV